MGRRLLLMGGMCWLLGRFRVDIQQLCAFTDNTKGGDMNLDRGSKKLIRKKRNDAFWVSE